MNSHNLTIELLKMRHHLKWIVLIFIVKLILFVFFSFQFYKNHPKDSITGKIFISVGETPTYYKSIENLADGNGYGWQQVAEKEGTIKYLPSTRRVPGILPFYYPLYKILGKETARVGIILIQFLFGVASIYMLALISLNVFQSKAAYYLTLGIYSISSFVSIFDHIGLAESFSTSFAIFAIFFLLMGLKKQQKYFIILSGLFICWSIFLRPAVGVFFPVMLLFYLWFNTKNHFTYGNTFKGLIILSMPLALTVSAWTVRNYHVTGQFIPLEDDIFKSMPDLYNPRVKAIRTLIGAWGGEFARWEKNSEGEWFFNKELDSDNHNVYNSRHFTSYYNLDSLIKLREIYWNSENPTLSETEREGYKIRTVETALLYTENYIKEKPLHYYVISPIILTVKFLFIKTTNYLPFPALCDMSLYHKIIKIFYILLYNLIMILGIAGIIISIFSKKMDLIIIILFPAFYIIVMSVIFKATEERYLVSLYPFLVLFSCFSINRIFKLNFVRKFIPAHFT